MERHIDRWFALRVFERNSHVAVGPRVRVQAICVNCQACQVASFIHGGGLIPQSFDGASVSRRGGDSEKAGVRLSIEVFGSSVRKALSC